MKEAMLLGQKVQMAKHFMNMLMSRQALTEVNSGQSVEEDSHTDRCRIYFMSKWQVNMV